MRQKKSNWHHADDLDEAERNVISGMSWREFARRTSRCCKQRHRQQLHRHRRGGQASVEMNGSLIQLAETMMLSTTSFPQTDRGRSLGDYLVNLIARNSIGTDLSGIAAIGNEWHPSWTVRGLHDDRKQPYFGQHCWCFSRDFASGTFLPELHWHKLAGPVALKRCGAARSRSHAGRTQASWNGIDCCGMLGFYFACVRSTVPKLSRSMSPG